MRKIEMYFYSVNPAPDNIGFKFVLLEILIEQPSGPEIRYDWGFCHWTGTEWDPIETPEGVTAVVHRWSNTVNPDLLLSEPKRIVRI